MPVEKLGKGVLLFGDKDTGGHIEGQVFIEGEPGKVVLWNLVPTPKGQSDQKENEEEKKLNLEERRRLKQKELDAELAKTRPGHYL